MGTTINIDEYLNSNGDEFNTRLSINGLRFDLNFGTGTAILFKVSRENNVDITLF
jgi:hypothetical protein